MNDQHQDIDREVEGGLIETKEELDGGFDPHIFALAGLLGCGKSTAADMIASQARQEFEFTVTMEMSDFVRREFKRQGADTDVNDNELGEWAARMKETYGDGYFARELADSLAGDCNYVISGLRSPKEAYTLRDEFGPDNVTVIAIWTLPDLRFERKYGDPPSEEHSDWETFHERNERELHEWDCLAYFADDISDYIISNNDDLENLEQQVEAIVRNELGDGSLVGEMIRDDPFPEGLDREQIAQYL